MRMGQSYISHWHRAELPLKRLQSAVWLWVIRGTWACFLFLAVHIFWSCDLPPGYQCANRKGCASQRIDPYSGFQARSGGILPGATTPHNGGARAGGYGGLVFPGREIVHIGNYPGREIVHIGN